MLRVQQSFGSVLRIANTLSTTTQHTAALVLPRPAHSHLVYPVCDAYQTIAAGTLFWRTGFNIRFLYNNQTVTEVDFNRGNYAGAGGAFDDDGSQVPIADADNNSPWPTLNIPPLQGAAGPLTGPLAVFPLRFPVVCDEVRFKSRFLSTIGGSCDVVFAFGLRVVSFFEGVVP